MMNTDLLKWDSKASHPWIIIVSLKFKGGVNGMPSEEQQKALNQIEDDYLLESLNDFDGYLNVGRETSSNLREIYFACKDFRKPSKVLYQLQKENKDSFEIEYEIYKDKYWRIFDRYGIL